MDIVEMKNKLHSLVDEANFEQLERMLCVANDEDDFVVPQEWIDEAEQRSADLRSGKDKGITLEEFKLNAEKLLQKKINELHSYNNSTSK